MGASRTTRRPDPNEEDSSSARDELLNTAIQLFAHKGFKGTSIRDIADAHDVSVSNIYHYFGNKEGLWLAIIERSVKDLPKRLSTAVESHSDPIERLRVLVRTHLENVERHHQEARIFFVDESMLSPDGSKMIRAVQQKIFDIYVKEISAMMELGLLRVENVKITALNILALINWHLRWFQVDGSLPATVLQDYIIDFALNGILGRKRPPSRVPAKPQGRRRT